MSPDDSRTAPDSQTETRPFRILFVCLGNICRSPSAEIVMNALLRREGLAGRVLVDSCGTAGYHTGQMPDRRMLSALQDAGYAYGGHRARTFQRDDFARFDLIVPQDHDNEADLLAYARSNDERARVRGMWHWFSPDERWDDVPDPYYGGAKGFADVVHLLERSCEKLLQDIRPQLNA